MQVSREPPPLSGGYEVRDEVYYQGASKTLDNGPHAGHDKLVHGQRGEVTGPQKPDSDGDERISVLFPGNKGSIPCLLTEVRPPTQPLRAPTE